jgi:hypothetical protein
MLVSKQTHQAALEKIGGLERQLEQAHLSLARYKDQERELVEALVAARVEARELRSRAENEAGSVIEGARGQAANIQLEARAQLAAAQAEITRLRGVQRELNTSLEQSLTVLRSVLSTSTLSSFPADIDDNTAPPRQEQAGGIPAPPTLSRARLAPVAVERPVSQQFPHVRTPSPVNRDAGLVGDMRARQSARQEPPVLAAAGGRSGAPWGDRKVRLRVATALVLAVACLGVVTGAVRWWRGSAGQTPRLVDSGVTGSPTTAAVGVSRSGTAEQAPPRAGAARGSSRARVSVVLRAVRPVWLRAEVDGKQTMARLMKPGEDVDLHGARDVVVRAGDAGALLVGVNGRTPEKFGRAGEVLTKRMTTEPAVAAAVAPRTPAASTPLLAASASARAPQRPPQRSSPPDAAPLPTPREPVGALSRRADPPIQAPSAAGSAGASASSLPSPHAVSEAGNEEGDVLRAHEDYFEALRRGDSGRMGRLVADGFSASGAPAADETGIPYEISLRKASVEVRGVGAVVSGTASQRISGPDGQGPRNQPLLFSEVWVKRNGQWQLMNVRFVAGSVTR